LLGVLLQSDSKIGMQCMFRTYYPSALIVPDKAAKISGNQSISQSINQSEKD